MRDDFEVGRLTIPARIHPHADAKACAEFAEIRGLLRLSAAELARGPSSRFTRIVPPSGICLHADGVHMPDWRAGDRAPSAGQKVAIMGRMREHPIFDVAMALKEVTDIAIRVLGTRELAEHWLAQPALALDGQRPLDQLATAPGVEAVKDLLTRMEFGVYT